MAGRKPEPGISYYRMNCGHTTNKKVRLLFNEFNSDGYWIWQCIIDYAYSHKGYYFDCNNIDELELFATDVCKKQVSLVNEVIAGCIRRGLFDETVSDTFGVLSSAMMQEVYFDATQERRRKGTEIEFYEELLLIEMPKNCPNVSIVPWNKSILPRKNDNVPRKNATEKSKVEESKVKKSKVNSNGVVPPDAGRKNAVVKDRKKEEEPEPHWDELVKIWFGFNSEKFKIKPSFKDADPRDFKKIVQQLKKRAIEKKFEWTEDVATRSLSKFLNLAFKNSWLKEHFLLENLNKQFDVIIQPKEDPSKIAAENFKIPLSQNEKQINSLYQIFRSGKLKITDLYDNDFDFLIRHGMKISESQNNDLHEAVQEYMQLEKLPKDQKTIESLAKRFAVIEHFKTLKQKGNVAVFGMD